MKIDELLNSARRFKAAADWERAEQYYDLALQEDSNNWEAFFFETFCGTCQGTIEEIPNTSTKIQNNLNASLQMIEELAQMDETTKKNAIDTVITSSVSLAQTNLKMLESNRKLIKDIHGDNYYWNDRYLRIMSLLEHMALIIEKRFGIQSAIATQYAYPIWQDLFKLTEENKHYATDSSKWKKLHIDYAKRFIPYDEQKYKEEIQKIAEKEKREKEAAEKRRQELEKQELEEELEQQEARRKKTVRITLAIIGGFALVFLLIKGCFACVFN